MQFIRKQIWRVLKILGVCDILGDSLFCRIQYFLWTGRILHLTHPKGFNEKVQWLKLNYRNPLQTVCADKWAVRDFVAKRIGENYLAKCIGVYDDVEEIHFDSLPEQFVLKATHGSGWNIICTDKATLDWDKAKSRMKRWLKSDFSRNGREWQYHAIKPQLICEEFLFDPSCPTLRDYKLLTFRGDTKYIWVDFVLPDNGKRSEVYSEVSYSKPKVCGGGRYRNFYNCEWTFQKGKGCLWPSVKTDLVSRPACLPEMISLARKLAHDFPQCRVDFYVIGGCRIVFGELTFTSGNGCNEFYPHSFDVELGSYLDLSCI